MRLPNFLFFLFFLLKLTTNRMLRFSFTSNVLRFTLWMFIEDKYFISSLYKFIFFYLLSMNLFSPIAPANKNNLGESWRLVVIFASLKFINGHVDVYRSVDDGMMINAKFKNSMHASGRPRSLWSSNRYDNYSAYVIKRAVQHFHLP